MANINIERKQSPWPYVIGLLLLLLVGWFVVEQFDDDDAVVVAPEAGAIADPAPAVAATPAATGAVAEFIRYADSTRAAQAMGPGHDFTAEGIRKLAAAIDDVARSDTVANAALAPQLADLRQRADSIQANPNATDHALHTREAFLIAASLIQNMQERRAPDRAADANAVWAAARQVDAKRPLLEQSADVERFFERSAAALRGMTPQGA
jgi:hypothetical protein